MVFGLPRPSKTALGGPQKAPKRRLKSSKGVKKVDLKIEPMLITFWMAKIGSRRGPNMGPLLLEPRPAASQRGPQPAFSGIIRKVCKGYWNWTYTLQKKGRYI